MKFVRCIREYRDVYNNVVGYGIMDANGRSKNMLADDLKRAIKNKRIFVTNLTFSPKNNSLRRSYADDTSIIRYIIQNDDAYKKLKETIEVKREQEGINDYSEIDRGIFDRISGMVPHSEYCNVRFIAVPNIKEVIKEKKGAGFKVYSKCKESALVANDTDIYIISHKINIVHDKKYGNETNERTYKSISFECPALVIRNGLSDIFKNLKVHDDIVLKSIVPSNMKSIQAMFKDCTARNIVIDALCTNSITNMSEAFSGCKAEEISLSRFDTSNVTTMRGMFCNSKINYLNLSNFDLSKLNSTKEIFLNCEIGRLDLSNVNLGKRTGLQEIFKCSRIKEIVLTGTDTENIENMDGMFYGSTIGHLKFCEICTSSVTSMQGMFAYSKIESIDLSTFNTSRVINMESMFEGCKTSRLDLTFLDTSRVRNMNKMFYECTVDTLDLSYFDTRMVKKAENMFRGSNIRRIIVGPNWNLPLTVFDGCKAKITGRKHLL